jgi:hypothetical protein
MLQNRETAETLRMLERAEERCTREEDRIQSNHTKAVCVFESLELTLAQLIEELEIRVGRAQSPIEATARLQKIKELLILRESRKADETHTSKESEAVSEGETGLRQRVASTTAVEKVS